MHEYGGMLVGSLQLAGWRIVLDAKPSAVFYDLMGRFRNSSCAIMEYTIDVRISILARTWFGGRIPSGEKMRCCPSSYPLSPGALLDNYGRTRSRRGYHCRSYCVDRQFH